MNNLDLLEARLRSLSTWTKSEILEREYMVSGSDIRKLNARLASEGIVIASSPKGYKRIFPPQNGEGLTDEDKKELENFLNNYAKRAISIFKHLRDVERKFYKPFSQDSFVFDKTPFVRAKEEIELL